MSAATATVWETPAGHYPAASLTKSRRLLLQAGIPVADWTELSLNAGRATNMTGGVHNDNLRMEIGRYQRQGRDRYLADCERERQIYQTSKFK